MTPCPCAFAASLPPARLLADGWRRVIQRRPLEERPRLEVTRPPPELDVLWIADQLLMPRCPSPVLPTWLMNGCLWMLNGTGRFVSG